MHTVMQATTHMEGEPVKREYSSTSKHGRKGFPASASGLQVGLSNRRIHAITGWARHHTSHKVNHRSGSSSFSSSRMTEMLGDGAMLFVCPCSACNAPARREGKKKKG